MKKSGIIGFIIGIASGSIITYFVSKNKFQILADREIESVREVYKKHFKSAEPEKDNNEKEAPSKDKGPYIDYTKKYGGNPSVEIPPEILKSTVTKKPKLYIISPSIFGNSEEYEIKSLTYYSNKTLVDEEGNIINNISETVGMEAIKFLDDHKDEDSVYVRDDDLKIDYEILTSEKDGPSICEGVINSEE